MSYHALCEYRDLKDIRCIVFVERVVTAVVLHYLLNELLPKYSSWKSKYIAGNNTGLQSQTRKKQNEIVEEFRQGMVRSFPHLVSQECVLSLISLFDCGCQMCL
jgi:ERCC4-related helicase